MTTKTKPVKKLTIRDAREVLSVVDAGLCNGKGSPIPGQMCVEAAACYALGQPHGDEPTCVSSAVRSFTITLNDSEWSSNGERARGMRKIAIAQLGTADTLDDVKFARELAFQTIRQIVPIALRAAAKIHPDVKHRTALEASAVACETAKDLDAARAASYAARAASYAASDASDAAKAASYAPRAAVAASYAARAARAAARAASDEIGDSILSLMADIGVEVLRKLGVKAVAWADTLCK